MVKKTIRLAIYERDGNKCVECGATDNLTLDHIKPISEGGSNSFSNLQTLCFKCNSKKASYQNLPFFSRIRQIWFLGDLFAMFKNKVEGDIKSQLGIERAYHARELQIKYDILNARFDEMKKFIAEDMNKNKKDLRVDDHEAKLKALIEYLGIEYSDEPKFIKIKKIKQ